MISPIYAVREFKHVLLAVLHTVGSKTNITCHANHDMPCKTVAITGLRGQMMFLRILVTFGPYWSLFGPSKGSKAILPRPRAAWQNHVLAHVGDVWAILAPILAL
jgi:hypothetical protein